MDIRCSLLAGHGGDHTYERGDGVYFTWPNLLAQATVTTNPRLPVRYWITEDGKRALREAELAQDLALSTEAAAAAIRPMLKLILDGAEAAGLTPSEWVAQRLRVGPEGWKC